MDLKTLQKASEECSVTLEYPFDEIIDIIGLDGLYRLSALLGGTIVYFPQPKKLFKNLIDFQVKKDYFNGYSFKKLACKYSLSESSLRKIIHTNTEPL